MIVQYKGYDIRPDRKNPTLLMLKVTGDGGGLPDVLSTRFTDVRTAKAFIDKYLKDNETLQEKVNARKANAKAGAK